MGRVKIDVVKVQNDSNFLFVRSFVCLFVCFSFGQEFARFISSLLSHS